MKGNRRISRPLSWMFFVLFTIVCAVYIYFNFDKANSLVSIDIEMDRAAALQKAEALATEFQIGPANYKQAAAFRNDSRFQNYVELEAGGLEKFKEIVENGHYYSYHWTVRHFEELNAHEVNFWFTPGGETLGFYEKKPESESGASLPSDEAQKIAEHHAMYNWNVNIYPYDIVEKSKEKQISGRVDHKFVYERNDKTIGDARYRLTLIVSGDRLTAVDYTVKIPENFDRRYAEMRSANDTLQAISTGIIALLYGLLGVVVAIFILIKTRRIIWKPAILWGMGITFFSVFLLTLNSIPFSWFSYDTSTSQSNFLLRLLLNGISGAIGFGAVITLSFIAAEGLGRMAFPKHIQWWKIWSTKTGGSLTLLQQTVAGYLLAVIIVAFDVLYYVTTTQHFGWWSPAGTLSNPNILATYLPWLDSIAISLQAGFWEEALFRAVPIAGVFILVKNKKSKNFWIVIILIIQTLIFGAAHANYAQQPSYARVLEMVIPFFIMGVVYIYFGILPAVIAHFTVDVFWISLPLWVTSESGIWIDRSFVLFFLFVPLLIVFFRRWQNNNWKKIPPSDLNKNWEKPEITEDTHEELIPTNDIKPAKDYSKFVIPLGIIGLLLWIILTPFKNDAPLLTLKKQDAIEIAKTEVEKKYELNESEWKILSKVADQVDIRDIFVWQEGGKEIYDSLLNNFLAPPHWQIRWVKTDGKAEEKTEEFLVYVLNSGEIMQLSHKIPEDRTGENLEKQEAQILVDSVLLYQYNLHRNDLKEISISPTKQKNRTDWEFIYADTLSYPLTNGQGRILINLSGKEISKTFSYIHIPEKWIRDYKQSSSIRSILNTVGGIFIFGTLLFGVVLGIIRWTRQNFKLSVFIQFTILFALLFAGEILLSWPSLMSQYSTEVPLNNFITSVFISLAISGIFFSLAHGIFIAATPGWIIPTANNKQYLAIFAGLLTMGIIALAESVSPQTTPNWVSQNFLNARIPVLNMVFSDAQMILIYPAFAWIFFLGIHKFTNFWQKSKYIGFIFALLAGLSFSAMNYVNWQSWLISSLIIATGLLALYIFFFRNKFELIPISFGIIIIAETINKTLIIKQPQIIIGGTISIIIMATILLYWQKILLANAKKDKSHQ